MVFRSLLTLGVRMVGMYVPVGARPICVRRIDSCGGHIE